MANIQKYFEKFHDIIRADYEMNSTLREKRDNILALLKRRLKENDRPSCNEIMQGSYKYGVGIQPIEELEFDIDVGLLFCFDESAHSAAEVRGWVFDAVNGHTKSVEEKGPCIRVAYAQGFHVDLVCYATWSKDGVEQFRLAHKTEGWRPADIPGLLDFIRSARKPFEGTEDSRSNTDQLRRTVRYLKRWNDEAIPYEANHKITGLGLLLFAIASATPLKFWDGTVDDMSALQHVATSAANTPGRIAIRKPTPEYEDMAGRLSDAEMDELKGRFSSLATACQKARDEVDPVEACKIMKAVLGRDFPVLEPKDTARKTSSPAIVTSSSSAER